MAGSNVLQSNAAVTWRTEEGTGRRTREKWTFRSG